MFKTGLSEKQIDQLIKYSNEDEVIAAYSSDPRRFKDRQAFDKWMEKKSSIYVLDDEEGNLFGITWFHEAPFPDVKLKSEFKNLPTKSYDKTFAIRLYDKARGRGLAKDFMLKALKTYNKTGIWLETSQDNIAAMKTYQPFFTQVSEPDENGKIVMIEKLAKSSLKKHSKL